MKSPDLERVLSSLSEIARNRTAAYLPSSFLQVGFLQNALINRFFRVYGHQVKPIHQSAIVAVFFLSLFFLSGCASSEQDADDVADTAIKGLSGQGTITPDKPTKDAFGSDYQ